MLLSRHYEDSVASPECKVVIKAILKGWSSRIAVGLCVTDLERSWARLLSDLEGFSRHHKELKVRNAAARTNHLLGEFHGMLPC